MCSINGVIISPRCKDVGDFLLAAYQLRQLIINAEDRGRDSWGLVTISNNGEVRANRRTGRPSKADETDFSLCSNLSVAINNNRAEPTTEYVEDKALKNIQPFQYSGWVVAHNGVIANDKELISKYGLRPNSKIDSAVLPAYLAYKLGNTIDIEWVRSILMKDIVGSYALAMANSRHPNDLILACNYKPLFLLINKSNGNIFFTSLEEYAILDKSVEGIISNPFQAVEIPPYTLVHFTRDEVEGRIKIKSYSLRTEKKNPHMYQPIVVGLDLKTPPAESKKALVVCSGGLDSVVTACLMQKSGYKVTLCHFKYGCRAEEKEIQAIEEVAWAMGFDTQFLEMGPLFQQIGGSKLTNTSSNNEIADGESGAEFAIEWVPARNLIMLSIAVGYAESHGYEAVVLGNNLEEAGAYPDNEQIFIHKFNAVLPHAVQVNKKVEVLMPVGNLMKHEIVKLGMDINAPLALTWSCYEGGNIHCGDCGPCYMRRKAFRMSGIEEVIPYEHEEK